MVRDQLDADARAGAQHHGALDDVLELADVARPVVFREQIERVRRELETALLVLVAVLFQEMVDQQRDVILAVAQRRQLNRDDVQAIEEILAEFPFLHHLPQVDVGRGDDAHVDLDRLHPAEAHEVALLDAALVGEVEHPLLRVDRAGEGTLDVAEERRLEQVRRQVAGIDGDEGSLRPRGVGVDRARHQLLAGAALALNQDGRAAGRRLDDQVEHLPHARALADDVRELVVPLLDVLAEVPVLADQPPPLHRVADDHDHFVVLERLRHVVERAGLHRGNRALDRRVGGDDDDVEVFVDSFQLVERGDAVEPRHHDVHDRRVERQRARQLESFRARGGQAYVVALPGQQRLENLAHDLFVVDDEDRAVS